MERKRSKGVTFWAWVFIIFSVLGIFDLFNYTKAIQRDGIALFTFTVLSEIAYIICGIYLLQFKEPARKAVIYLGIISLIAMPFLLAPTLKSTQSQDAYYIEQEKVIREQTKPEYQQQTLEKLKKGQEIEKKYGPIVTVIFLGISLLLLGILPIYFFTRPKVKEQFIETNKV